MGKRSQSLSAKEAKDLLREHGPGKPEEKADKLPAILYARAPLDLLGRLQTLVVARKRAKIGGTLIPGTPTQQASIIRKAVEQYLDGASPTGGRELSDGSRKAK